MFSDFLIPEPFQFNPLKHHYSCIREFISSKEADENRLDVNILVKEVKHIGSSVMDVYTGRLSVREICQEIHGYLLKNGLENIKDFSAWTGTTYSDFRTVSLSDTSQWTLKYHNDDDRYVHIFPVRSGPHSFRVKANTLKSAMLYYVLIGKDLITSEDLNKARSLLGLSPVKGTTEADAIIEMIEILRR